MKSDLDLLIQERGFDAIVVMGSAHENPAMAYITGGAKISSAFILKKPGETALLICSSMERDEAAKSGLRIATFDDYHFLDHVRASGNRFEAFIRLYVEVFQRNNVSGTVSFYGLGSPGTSYLLLKRLQELLPGVTITGETETTIFDRAYATKDTNELIQIRDVAARTNRVMAETVDFLKSHRARANRLIRGNGSPLTIGEVRQFINRRLMEQGLEASEGIIFAMGRDGGVPHSRGEDDQVLETGRAIVFDLFPRQIGGGYFHDMTRTFSLGYATPEVEHAYRQVMQAFDAVVNDLSAGERGEHYQELTCDIFEEQGHPTIRSKPGTTDGYIHNLGHGLGLEIHSRPRLAMASDEVLEPGQVFTVEPGLYYPEKGFGIRVEDTYVVEADGTFTSLTPYPKDLVIPIQDAE
ncbi:MAG: aminopeptidase P family protein [Anaerolineae bacterium]|nr:aminopeptidase P family protein [Anaerolineae bacterium]